MTVRDAYPRQPELGLEYLLAIFTLGSRLEGLSVKCSSGLGVTLVEGDISLKVERLGHDRLGLDLLCQTQRFSEGFLAFLRAPRLGKCPAITAQAFRHHVAAVLKLPKSFDGLFLGVHGSAVASLDAEQRADTVGIDGGVSFVAGLSEEMESAMILVQRFVVLSKLRFSLRQIVNRLGDFSLDVQFLAQLEGLLEIRKRVVVLSFCEVHTAYVV